MGLSLATIATAGPGDDKPLPGSDLTLRQAVEQADAVAIGRELHVLMGGGSSFAVHVAEADIAESLKGDLPRGRMRLNAITVFSHEALPLTDGGHGKEKAYLIFLKAWEKKGHRGHRVIKMLRPTEENLRAVRELLPK